MAAEPDLSGDPVRMTSQFRPVAYVSLPDRDARQRAVGVLERAGWLVIPQPSVHALLRALAGVRQYPWLEPGLVVVDTEERATEVRAGFSALGVTVPVVVAGSTAHARRSGDDSTLSELVGVAARAARRPSPSLEQSL